MGAILWAARGSQVGPAELELGDCLYVGAVADPAAPRPIGEPHDVAGALLLSGAERASCDASHGHEVSAVVAPTWASESPGGGRDLPNHDQMAAMIQPLCDAAFAGYVGHALESSRYLTFPVVPDSDGAARWVAGGMRTVCLVARADGQWMDHPARGSGE